MNKELHKNKKHITTVGRELDATDLDNLRKSFITPEIAHLACLSRVSDAEGAEIVGRKRRAGTNYAGIVFPYFRPPNYGRPLEYRLRRDEPDLEQVAPGNIKEKAKYLSPPGRANMVYFPPGISEKSLSTAELPVVITEGEKKALALSRLAHGTGKGDAPFLPIALSGVWNFRGTVGKATVASGEMINVKGEIADLDLIGWKGRDVTIVYDSNAATNRSVKNARAALADVLTKRGARVRYADLPADRGVNGVDDYLAALEQEHGTDGAIEAGLEFIRSGYIPGRSTATALSNFHLERSGPQAGLYFVDDHGKSLFICSPIEVIAITHSIEGDNYGRLLRWSDCDGRVKTWAMPVEWLHGESVELIKYLTSRGLRIGTSRKHYDSFRSYINLATPEKRLICSDRVGWVGDTYILPEESFGGSRPIVLQSDVIALQKFTTKGSLDEWKDAIGRYCRGNTRLAFAVSAAFACPLLPALGIAGGGIHFRGTTSTGKTTALLVAGSVFGGSDEPSGYCQTWRATANGLETVCESHNHALLCLDEIGECDARQVGEVAYMIANGQGKSRMSKTIRARRTISWQLLFLSTGEQKLADLINESGGRVKGGQEIRLCDIDADTGAFGLFETTHDLNDGQAFSDHLRAASGEFYGSPIRRFLREYVKLERAEIVALWQSFHLCFLEKVLPPGREYPSEVRRVATRFSLIAFAGELASEFDVTGWETGEAINAAAELFRVWQRGRAGDGGSDAEGAIRQVRAFLENHGQSRFHDLDCNDENRVVSNRVGFRKTFKELDETVYLILPESFKNEVCRGYDSKFVASELKKRGLLDTDRGINQKTMRLPGIGNKKVYSISSRIFDGGESTYYGDLASAE